MLIGMKDEADHGSMRELGNRFGDGLESRTPAFAPMACDQDGREGPFPHRGWGQLRFDGDQRIDRGVTGDMDFSRNILCSKILGGRRGGREQQVSVRVDSGAIFLLWPRKEWVMSS
jgi:hypothetical protein